MPSPGEIYLAEHPAGQKHPFLIVSRDELNRGKRVIRVNINPSVDAPPTFGVSTSQSSAGNSDSARAS